MFHESATRTIDLLLVEDDPADVLLMEEVFDDLDARVNLHVARDGEEAMQFVRREGKNAQAPQPSIILLDVNMPKLDGFEVLALIKTDPRLRRIPVVMLTTSDSQQEVLRAYDSGAAGFISKPMGFDDFSRLVDAFNNYWFKTVVLPTSDPPEPITSKERDALPPATGVRRMFEIECDGDILLLSPLWNMNELSELHWNSQVDEILSQIGGGHIRNIVIDFQHTTYFGSTALGLFVHFWKTAVRRGGQMVFCNLSPEEMKILETVRMENLWPICNSRQDALRMLKLRAKIQEAG